MPASDRSEAGCGILIGAGQVASLMPSLFVNDN
jgi:hypothetical protein